MTYQTSDFFFKSLATQGQAVINTLGNKFKSNPALTNAGYQAQQKIWGNTPVNNSATALTRNQRSANIKYGTAPDARTEALASQSVGRGLNKQQAPRNGQKPLAPDEFLDAGGVVRKKMSVGNWKSQQQFQTGQYGGFSGNFQHFANFAGNPYVGAAKIGSLVGLGAGLAKGGGLGESEEERANTTGLGRIGKMVGRGAQGAATGAFLGAAGRVTADGTGITKGAKYLRNKFAKQTTVSTKIPIA